MNNLYIAAGAFIIYVLLPGAILIALGRLLAYAL